jgi:FdhD protein
MAERLEHFECKKCNLSFVILLVIEEAIAPDAPSRHAFDRRYLNGGVLIRFATVMAKKIVPRRDVKVTDFHWDNDIIALTNVIHGVANMNETRAGIGAGQIIRRKKDGSMEFHRDDLTVEEPLEIRVGRRTVATTMRTPGHDEELAAGFLVSEGLVRNPGTITGFTRPDKTADRENIIVVTMAAGSRIKLNSAQRFGTISSSCGLCGKTSIAAIRQHFAPIEFSAKARVEMTTLLSLPALLQQEQGDFVRTGGIHAAGVFDFDGTAEIVREDIGRHNAVDKVIGRAFLDDRLPLGHHVLLVSGRASFEIMQKALAAGIPVIASVSAPSTLAMNFARESGQTLIGFLRPPAFNIYAHAERIVLGEM